MGCRVRMALFERSDGERARWAPTGGVQVRVGIERMEDAVTQTRCRLREPEDRRLLGRVGADAVADERCEVVCGPSDTFGRGGDVFAEDRRHEQVCPPAIAAQTEDDEFVHAPTGLSVDSRVCDSHPERVGDPAARGARGVEGARCA